MSIEARIWTDNFTNSPSDFDTVASGKPDNRYEHIQSMIISLPACVGHMDIDISCSILIFVFYNSWLSHMKNVSPIYFPQYL